LTARREEDLGGGRASWLVPFDVIIHYTKQNPRNEKEGEETRRKRERNPPLKTPPRKEKTGGRGEKGRQKAREEERGSKRKKRC
jgi:hypothetical protein